MGPLTVEPSPYSMEKVPVFLDEVEDEVALYLDLDEQVELVHDEEGIQRSDEPAKKRTNVRRVKWTM
jgi:hypothetical protein